MKFFGVVTVLTLCFRLGSGLSFQQFLPIKHDIIKVRHESDIKLYPDKVAVLDFVGMVEKNEGYTAEEHYVTTPDGYNLKLHRISGSPSSPKRHGKSVVFLMHGIVSSSDCWVLSGPGKDLAYLLADAGYDVWLGNARGNTYSRSHVNLKPSNKKFWDFSWHEIGTIDLPTFIDYILEMTYERQLVYVGHSMGTTASFVLLSKLRQYNNKIKLVISLAPIAFWNINNLPFILRFSVDNFEALHDFSEKNNFYELLPQSSFLVNLAKTFCSNKNEPFKKNPCSQLLNQILPILNLDTAEFSYTEILKHFTAGASVKSVFHYIQNAAAAEFQEYDYGILNNLEKYSEKNPPSYDLTNIIAPTALFYGGKDYFSPSGENLQILRNKLPNVVHCEKINILNHADFFVSKNVKQLLYDSVLRLIHDYNNCSLGSYWF